MHKAPVPIVCSLPSPNRRRTGAHLELCLEPLELLDAVCLPRLALHAGLAGSPTRGLRGCNATHLCSGRRRGGKRGQSTSGAIVPRAGTRVYPGVSLGG